MKSHLIRRKYEGLGTSAFPPTPSYTKSFKVGCGPMKQMIALASVLSAFYRIAIILL